MTPPPGKPIPLTTCPSCNAAWSQVTVRGEEGPEDSTRVRLMICPRPRCGEVIYQDPAHSITRLADERDILNAPPQVRRRLAEIIMNRTANR